MIHSNRIWQSAPRNSFDLDIGVIYTNERDYLRPLLTSLSRSGDGLAMRLILIDNASDEGVGDYKHIFPSTITLRNSVRRNYASNLNRILAASSARYVLLLNTDMYFPPREQCLAKMVRFMDARPDCGLSVCRVFNADGKYAYPARRFQTLSTFVARRLVSPRLARRELDRYLCRDQDFAGDFECDWVSGCFMLVRREAAKAIGGFDAGFRKYFEDVDYCARMRMAGWRVMFHGGASCIHYEQRSSAHLLSRDAIRHAISYARWLKKWGIRRRATPAITSPLVSSGRAA